MKVSRKRAFDVSFFISLLVSVSSLTYIYLAPEGFYPAVVFGAPLAVLAIGVSAKALSAPEQSMG